MSIPLDQLPDDTDALKRIIAAMAQDAVNAQAARQAALSAGALPRGRVWSLVGEVAARSRAARVGDRGAEAEQAERLAAASPVLAVAIETAIASNKPARRALPNHLPREDRVHAAPCTCQSCGGALRRIGEDITETLECVPGRFK